MAYGKCKVYYDGSHYIGIPPQPQKPRPKKGAKVKKEVPELEELDAEEEDCPFDNPVQLSLFDGENGKKISTNPRRQMKTVRKPCRQVTKMPPPAKRYSSGCIKNICTIPSGRERARS